MRAIYIISTICITYARLKPLRRKKDEKVGCSEEILLSVNCKKNWGNAPPQALPQFNLHPFPSAKVTFLSDSSKCFDEKNSKNNYCQANRLRTRFSYLLLGFIDSFRDR